MRNALLRSLVWLGAATWLAFQRKPEGATVLAVRTDAIGWLGGVLLVVGLALHLWSNLSLARGEDVSSTAPIALIIQGPFRYVRNPIYLAGIPLLAGTHLLYPGPHVPDLIAAILVMTLFHVEVVRLEEPKLRTRFGAAYEEYCRQVPRWVPRF